MTTPLNIPPPLITFGFGFQSGVLVLLYLLTPYLQFLVLLSILHTTYTFTNIIFCPSFPFFCSTLLSYVLPIQAKQNYFSFLLMEIQQQPMIKSRFRRICVYCGSSPGKNPSYQLAAIQLGKQLVERNIDLVYGGGSIGLMGLISQVVYDGGRHVLGVIPKTLMPREITGETVGEVRAVSGMHQRKAEMARQADAFIALPGGYGTLEELLEIITWAQLGIHDKPVGLLNVDGYYNSLLAFMDKAVDEGFVTPAARHIIVSAHTAQDLMCKLEEYVPKHSGVAPKLSWEMEQQLVNTAKSDISR